MKGGVLHRPRRRSGRVNRVWDRGGAGRRQLGLPSLSGPHFSPLLGAQCESTASSGMSARHTSCHRHVGPAPSSVEVVTGPVHVGPWLERTDGVRRGASLRDSGAEELPTPARAACNVWLNFLSN